MCHVYSCLTREENQTLARITENPAATAEEIEIARALWERVEQHRDEQPRGWEY